MTRLAFIEYILAERKRTGRKPHRVTLTQEGLRELIVGMTNVPPLPTSGYVMNFVGVEVFVE